MPLHWPVDTVKWGGALSLFAPSPLADALSPTGIQGVSMGEEALEVDRQRMRQCIRSTEERRRSFEIFSERCAEHLHRVERLLGR